MFYHGYPKPIRYVVKFCIAVVFRFAPVRCSKWLGVRMGNNVRVYGGQPGMWGTEPYLISFGNNVFITSGCTFLTHDGGTLILRSEVPDLELTAPISVGNDVYFGIRVIVMPGVTIGSRVIIGAGSIVTKDIPDNSVAVGVPARVIKSVDEYLESAKERSLKIGNLPAAEKDKALRNLFATDATEPHKK